MRVTLPSLLLFCLFSFLFGVFCSLFLWMTRALCSALRVLPYRERQEQKEKKTKRRYVFGYFFFDFFSCVFLAVFYLIFLYAANGGAFRLYSLLLAVLGGVFFYAPAERIAYPVFFVSSRIVSLLLRFFKFPFLAVVRLLQKKKRKAPSLLDETEKMV